MHYTDIDPVSRHADLGMSFVARRLQPRQEPSLEITAGLFSGPAPWRDGAAIGIFQKLLQTSNAAAISGRYDATGVERSKDSKFSLRASEQHVESPMAISAVQRTEVLVENAFRGRSVYRRN